MYGHGSWYPETKVIVLIIILSKITDHRLSQQIMKKFELLRELPKCDRDSERANAAGKMEPIACSGQGCYKPSIRKNNAVICEAQQSKAQ